MGARIYTGRRTVISRGALDAYAHLDGDSQYFYCTDANGPEMGISGANDLTIQGWIKPDVGAVGVLVSKFLDTGDKYMYAFVYSSNELLFYISDDGSTFTSKSTSGMDIIEESWTHVAVAYDASAGTADFYKDGAFVEQATGFPNSIADKDPDFCIGKWNANHQHFEGSLFNFALFDDIRTVGEILTSANDRQIDLSAEGNLIGNWMFNEAANAAAIDNTQGDSGRDLTPYDGGDVTYGSCGRTTGLIW